MSAETEGAISGGAESHSAQRGRAIFISYRRDDTEGESGRLYDDLVRTYGDSSVFMDVSGIQPGIDFRTAIDDNIAACGVLLAVIGPTWATITGHDGARRLDNPSDYVRLEIASALKRGIPVIPVLVHDAHMPALEQLPDDIKDLRYRNSVELTHARWNSDVPLLIAALKNYVDARPSRPEAPVHATVPVQLPAPAPKPPAEKPRPPFSLGIALGALTVIGALALIFFLVLRPRWEARHEASPAFATPSTTTPASGSLVTPSAAPLVSQSASGVSSSAPASQIPLEMIGVWRSSSQDTLNSDSLTRLAISEFAGQFTARAFGSCPGKPCDWGTRKLTVDNGFAVTTEPWEPRNTDKDKTMQRQVSISMAVQGGTLLVTVKNLMNDPDKGKRVVMRSLQLKKAQ